MGGHLSRQQEQWTKGTWWKFDSYELFRQTIQGIEQTYIRPSPTSALHAFDPWLNYRDPPSESPSPEVKRLRRPPYQSLVDLVEDIDSRPRSRRASTQLDPESETELLEWCSQHGLLGTLPHVSRQLNLAPVWKPIVFAGQEVQGVLAPHVKRYSRTATGWQQLEDFHLFGPQPSQPAAPLKELQPGTAVAADFLPPSFAPPSTIVQTSLLDIRLIQQPLSKTGNFFPSLPFWDREKYQYPFPLSDDFWRLYAEPLDDFMEAARTLATAIRALSSTKGERHREEREKGAAIITALTSPVMVSVFLDEEGKPRQQLASPSLLSSYAFMAMLDLTRGTVYECKNQKCGRIYISDAWQSQYCSTRCKYTEQKREQRRSKCQGRSESFPPRRRKRGPLVSFRGRFPLTLGAAGAEPCDAR